ncbi:hypothetical protein Droror1_Dr00026811, partial [Drosera rotundifolia]
TISPSPSLHLFFFNFPKSDDHHHPPTTPDHPSTLYTPRHHPLITIPHPATDTIHHDPITFTTATSPSSPFSCHRRDFRGGASARSGECRRGRRKSP